MCGICVVVSDVGAVEAELLHGMCERMVHRGPDAEGLHVEGRVGLGMRRLSVIDLPGGQQPIFNEDRSMAIVFNGEIYNYRELRDDLVARGHTFSTASDTEAILHAYEEYGPAAVTRLRGMFAFAIHERKSGRVFLARDRLGIKPLHWAEAGGRFYAASELKSLRGLPGLPLTLDEVAVDQYFSLLYVPAPRTIFREIKKLPPGYLLVKDPGQPAVIRRYWQLHARPDRARSEADWIAGVRRGLDDAVASHLDADVPLGLFLSGGVDSSALVASMSRAAAGRIKTFSVGFPSEYAAFDERPFARQVAERFGTDHQEMEVAPDIGEAMQALGRIFDEPMGDSGAVPNLLVCRMARQHLTVALSGLGGDELAGGYQRYLGVTVAEWYRKIPAFLRNDVVRRLVDLVPESRGGARGIDQAEAVRPVERAPLRRTVLRLLEPARARPARGALPAGAARAGGARLGARADAGARRGATRRRSAQQDPLHRPADLPGRRSADRRRPHQHGGLAGGPRPLPRPPVRRADGGRPRQPQDPGG